MSAELEGAFPNLAADDYTVASPKTQAYYPGNQDPHKSLQRIRSSNSQLRLPRDQDQPRNPPKYTEKRIRINFPFPCPSRGQLPPVGWGRSVVTRS